MFDNKFEKIRELYLSYLGNIDIKEEIFNPNNEISEEILNLEDRIKCMYFESIQEISDDKAFITSLDIRKLIKHLKLNQGIKEIDYQMPIELLELLSGYFEPNKVLPNIENECWKDIIEILVKLNKIKVNNFKMNDYELDLKINSAKYLIDNKFNVTIEEDEVYISKDISEKIHKKIENLVMYLGGQNLINILLGKYLNTLYNDELKKYMIHRQKTTFFNEPLEAQIPWNYIIQISLKYFSKNNIEKVNSNRYLKELEKLFEITKAYTVCLNIQSFSIYTDIFLDSSSLPKYYYQNILYDKLFCIKQWNKEYARKILIGLYEDYFIKVENKRYEFNEYVQVFDELLSNHNYVKTFKYNELCDRLSNINPSKIEAILKDISYEKYEVNKDFKGIWDEINFYKKPIIKYGEQYVILPSSLTSYSFIEVIDNKIKESYRRLNRDLGSKYEEYIKYELDNKGYKYLDGGYKYTYNNESKDNECDLILEDENNIVFIEIKKRIIDENIYKGDDVRYYVSLADSLMHSQLQSGYHMIQLIHNGKLELYKRENGKTDYSKKIGEVDYNNKNIIRISLVLQDYGFIDNKNTTEKFLNSIKFMNYKAVDAEREKELEKFNKTQEKLNAQFDIIKNIQGHNDKVYFNSVLRSFQQIMCSLENSNSVNEFIENLTFDLHISFGNYDFYQSLYNYKGISSIK
ncbi:hypothetical protein [Romboutsia sp. 1001713B170207_170306_H8]|uniref:hypothetical protein n=1 Tax=Romboutsia sp. 1001713B170207_170306_H8 TaxID=2787112 RepID=UPI001897BB1F|nr:hypothetical protein [Romboutsia sp. 1001713B170207_170306_H8]